MSDFPGVCVDGGKVTVTHRDNFDISKGGVKWDADKTRFDLLPAAALEEVARVYTFGARKYDDNNWLKGMRYGRTFAALLRHAYAWMRGETFDPETGLHHMAHAAFNCLALVQFDKFKDKYKSYDDRWRAE